MNYQDIPCVKDKAYFILVTYNGSWLINSMWDELNNEDFCRRIISGFEQDMMHDISSIQQIIDESYDEMMSYRARQVLEKI